MVGISGVAVMPPDLAAKGGISDKDVPFTHPFGGYDWQFFIAPDQEYESLLAPSNTGRGPNNAPLGEGEEFREATDYARQALRLDVPKGVLGVETDKGLVPEEYRAQPGDRVVAFGRWIVDSGHSDFHSEIHPPFLLVSARPTAAGHDPDHPQRGTGALEGTMSKVISRPYLVSQEFGDGALREHLIKEVTKVICPGFPFAAALGRCSVKVEANPRFMPKPFQGPHVFQYFVRPPSARRFPGDRLLVSYHFTVRRGVAVQVFRSAADTVGVLIGVNDTAYTPPPLPQKHAVNLSMDDIQRFSAEAADIYRDVIIGAALAPLGPVPTNPAAAALLATGIKTEQYDSPRAASSRDTLGVVLAAPLEQLPNPSPVSVDDSQPFPIYGWLNVAWQRDLRGVQTGQPSNQ